MCLTCEDFVRPEFGSRIGHGESFLDTLPTPLFTFLRPCSLAQKIFGYNLEDFLNGAMERTETKVGDDRKNFENHCCTHYQTSLAELFEGVP